MEEVKRIEKWDILKFFLIFLVVLGHIIQTFNDESGWMNAAVFWIYTFHMPVFLFVSGLFSKRTVNEKRYDKMTVFLFLFLLSKIILFFSRVIAYGTTTITFIIVGDLPWYMLAMFVFMLLATALKSFKPSYILPLLLLIACTAGYDARIDDTFAFMRIVVFYPFFYFGYCLDPKAVMKFSDKKSVKALSAVILIAFTVLVATKIDFLYQFKPLLTGRANFSALDDLCKYGFLFRLGYYAAVLIIGGAVVCLTPNRLSKKGIIAKMGSRSLQVYVIHYIFIHLIDGRFKEYLLDIHPAITFFVLAAVITVICSLKIWEPLFKAIMNPFRKVKKE